MHLCVCAYYVTSLMKKCAQQTCKTTSNYVFTEISINLANKKQSQTLITLFLVTVTFFLYQRTLSHDDSNSTRNYNFRNGMNNNVEDVALLLDRLNKVDGTNNYDDAPPNFYF